MQRAFFEATDQFYGPSLFMTDGTAAGTRRAKHYGTSTDGIYQIVNLREGELVIPTVTEDGSQATADLFDTNGKLAGHLTVSLSLNFVIDGLLYYADFDRNKIFVTDGTSRGTTSVLDLPHYDGRTTAGINFDGFCQIDGDAYCYFRVFYQDSTSERQLYRLSPAGSTLVASAPTSGPDDVSAFVKLGKTFIFNNDSDKYGKELWVSDGTAKGTHLLKDIYPGVKNGVGYVTGLAQSPSSVNSGSQTIFVVNNRAVFAATNGRPGNQLWATDGTATGTRLIKKVTTPAGIETDPYSSITFAEARMIGGDLLFSMEYFNTQPNIQRRFDDFWLTDGTAAGTHEVSMSVGGARVASYGSTCLIGDRLYFTGAEEATAARQGLYAYDFATKRTSLIKLGPDQALDFQPFGDGFLFTNHPFNYNGDDTPRNQLWISDGTAAGTHLVKSINPDGSSPFVDKITVFGDPRTTDGDDVVRLSGRDGGTVDGGSGNDRIYGALGADTLKGGDGNDDLHGGSGNDILSGGLGMDRLFGDQGADILTGGAGADLFVFAAVGDSLGSKSYDTVADFTAAQHDRIDVSSIDADTKATGDQAFRFIRDRMFSETPGELRFADGFLSGDVNGDGRADFRMALTGISSLQSADLVR